MRFLGIEKLQQRVRVLEADCEGQFQLITQLQQDVADTNKLLRSSMIRLRAVELACEEEFETLHRELDRVELHVRMREAETPTLRVIQ